MTTIIDRTLIDRLGWTLLHSLWEGAAILVLVALGLAFLRKRSAQARYLVACGALFTLAMMPALTFLWTNARPLIADPANSAPKAALNQPVNAPVSVTLFTTQPRSGNEPKVASHADRGPLVTPPPVATMAPLARASGLQLIYHLHAALPWLVFAWAAGVLAMAIWNLGGWIAIHQLKSMTTSPAGTAVEAAAARIITRLGLRQPVRLLQSALAQTPLVIGAIKPVILLPASVLTELSIPELESVLAHELAHVLRHDYLVNLLQTVIETVLFYHPAVWWISGLVRIERENCCDDIALSVTRDRAAYVTALAAVASVRVPALAPAASGGKLLPRLRRVLGIPDSDAGRSSRWMSGAIVIAACVLATLVIALRPTAKADAAEDEDLVTVHGRVVGPDDRPISNARVMAAVGEFNAPLSEVRSGADGKFEISFRKSQFDGVEYPWEFNTAIAATAPGLCPAWAAWDKVNDHGEVVLTLTADDVPIEGRILDLEGQPVVGAQVRLHLLRATARDLNAMNLDMTRKAPADDVPTPAVAAYAIGLPQPILTGAGGRFRISGLGRDHTATLSITGPGIASTDIDVVTRPMQRQVKNFQTAVDVATFTVYGASFDYAAAPGRAVVGTVRDVATHQPLAGVALKGLHYLSQAITDARGQYRIEGVPKKKGMYLTAMPDDQQSYFMSDAEIPDSPGLAPLTVDFDLHRGLWITGKITDMVTGKPIAGSRIQYLPYLDNPYAKELPEFHTRGNQGPGPVGRYMSKSDGSYRIVAMPGRAIVTVLAMKLPYRTGVGADKIKGPTIRPGWYSTYQPYAFANLCSALHEVDLPKGLGDFALNFQCDPGITIHVTIVDPDGRPLAGVESSLSRGKSKSAKLDAFAFRPDEQRTFIFRHEGLKLGKVVTVGPADVPSRELTVKLEPFAYVRGRLIGSDSQPVANALVRGLVGYGAAATTDADGHFELPVLAGKPYYLRASKGRDESFTDVKDLVVPPGTTKDVGDVHFKPPARAAAEQKATVPAQINEDVVTVHGRVLDPDARPVAGAKVSAVSHGWTDAVLLSETRSGADGAFEISFRKSQFSANWEPWENAVVAVTAAGFAPAWARWNQVDSSGKLALKLPPDDIALFGRILDLEGRPVSGATVKVHHVKPRAPDLKSLTIDGLDPTEENSGWSPELPGIFAGVAQPVISGKDGRFQIRGLGRSRTAILTVDGPNLAHSAVEVQTRPGPVQSRMFQPDVAALPITETTYGPKFDFTMAPGRSVTGTVRDANTHQPLAGVLVQTEIMRSGPMVYRLKATTDERGQYRMEGLPKKKVQLTAVPNDQQPYIMRDVEIPDAAGLAPLTIDFDLHRGVWITGKVTDKATGEPVYTRINYLPYLTNKYALAMPEFQEKPIKEIPGDGDRYHTRADGTYRIAALPGPALVAAWFSAKRPYIKGVGADQVKCPKYRGQAYQVYRPWISPDGAEAIGEVDIGEGIQETTVNFELDPGITIHMDLTDAAGEPLTGVAVAPAWPGYNFAERQRSSTFEAIALKPDEKYAFFFRDNAHKLGRAIDVRPADVPTGQMTVKLAPWATITGRLIDKDGQPVANALLVAGPLSNCGTDAQGRFRLVLMPGREYHLQGSKGRVYFDTDTGKIPSMAGSSREIGDIHMKPLL